MALSDPISVASVMFEYRDINLNIIDYLLLAEGVLKSLKSLRRLAKASRSFYFSLTCNTCGLRIRKPIALAAKGEL